MNIMAVWNLVVGAINDALNLNWSELSYKKGSLIVGAATLLVAVFFTTLVIRWRLNRRASSFYYTNLKIERHYQVGIPFKIIRGLAWTLVFSSLCFLGIALADPVVFIANTTEQIESREVIYVGDVSASNGFKLSSSKISRGEFGRETLESLVVKRKNKQDRAAYVVFATQSEIWSGFTMNFESLLFSITKSPLALAPAGAREMWPGQFILKNGQFVETDTDQETNLHLGLELAIYLFDKKGSPEITEKLKRNPNAQMRSVIIITDGAADKDPEPQFRELRKRSIIPYLIFIDPKLAVEKEIYGNSSPKTKLPDRLLALVRQSGGQNFLAQDSNSINRISETLDKLQGVKQIKKIHIKEKEVYFVPLALAVILAFGAMSVRLFFFRIWRKV